MTQRLEKKEYGLMDTQKNKKKERWTMEHIDSLNRHIKKFEVIMKVLNQELSDAVAEGYFAPIIENMMITELQHRLFSFMTTSEETIKKLEGEDEN